MIERWKHRLRGAFAARPVVGVDVGSTAVKLTWFRRGLVGADDIVVVERMLPDFADANGDREPFIAEHLRSIAAEFRLSAAHVVIAVPTHWLFTRVLTLPFTDPKKVAQVVPFETEELIPLPLDEVVLDHTILHSDTNGSLVLVVAAPKDRLSRHLELLTAVGIDPAQAELDTLALYHFYRYALSGAGRDIALVDIGSSKSTICLVADGEVSAVRSILLGGNTLTEALMDRLGCSRDAAEARKRELVVPMHGSSEFRSPEDAVALHAFLDPFVNEILNTVQAFEMTSGRRVHQLFLCGGGSKLKGLAPYVARQLDVEPVEPPNTRAEGGRVTPLPVRGTWLRRERDRQAPTGHQWDGAFAASIGLAVRPAFEGRGGAVNLRRGPFAVEEPEGRRRRTWSHIGLLLALLAIVGLTHVSLDYSIKESTLEQLKRDLRNDFQRTFPTITTVVDEIQQGRMALVEAKQRLALFGNTGAGAILQHLAELTTGIPEDRPLDIHEVTIEDRAVKIEATTDSFESVEAVKAALTTSGRFLDVTVSDARMGAKPGEVKFRVTLAVGAQCC